MAQLIVRNLEAKLVEKLKLRAAQQGRSVEAEHREILRQALSTRASVKTLKQRLLDMPFVGKDTDFVAAK